MPRKFGDPHRRAYNEPGHGHELTFSCHGRHPFLSAERTCLWLAEAIDRARRALEFSVPAYVFMPEHIHLVVLPRRTCYDVASILKAIKVPVARRAISYLEEKSPE